VLFAASYPSRTTALVGLEVYADPMAERMVGVWGTGEFEHVLNPDMPWNEEVRATWGRHERLTRPTRLWQVLADHIPGAKYVELPGRNLFHLLDAHDAVVRSQLARFRGREVSTAGDGFLAVFDGPQRAIGCAMAIRDAVQALALGCARRARCETSWSGQGSSSRSAVATSSRVCRSGRRWAGRADGLDKLVIRRGAVGSWRPARLGVGVLLRR
jgi:hypothetical protein